MTLNFAGTNTRRLTDAQVEQCVYNSSFTVDVQQSALDTESVAYIMDGTEPINNLVERAVTGGAFRMFLNIWPASPDRVQSPWYANPAEIAAGDLVALSQAYFRRWGASRATGWFTKSGNAERK